MLSRAVLGWLTLIFKRYNDCNAAFMEEEVHFSLMKRSKLVRNSS
jgi:hypothetical protein